MRRATPSKNQRGYLIMTIGVMGSIMTLGVLGMFHMTAYFERRAIEESLAQTRTYWAAMGAFNFVLSRTYDAGACACDFDTKVCPNPSGQCSDDMDRVYSLMAFRDELDPPVKFSYEGIPNDYIMNITLDIENDEAGSSPDNGHLKMTATVSSVGGHSFLKSIRNHLHVWEMGFCIQFNDNFCYDVTDTLGPTETSGLTHIKYVRRR